MKAGKFAKALVHGVAKTAREMREEGRPKPGEAVVRIAAPAPDPEWERRQRERREKAREGNAFRRELLAGLGVDVDAFTPEGVANDVGRMVRTFVPRADEIGILPVRGRAMVSWSNLTKTQRLPKCVATGSLVGPDGDGVVATVRYLRDATPYSADLNIWHGRYGLRVGLREAGGDLGVSSVVCEDIDRGLSLPLYATGSADSPDRAMALGVEYLLAGR